MDKVWLKHYPAGVPAEVRTDLYASLVTLLEQGFARHRGAPVRADQPSAQGHSRGGNGAEPRDGAVPVHRNGVARVGTLASLQPKNAGRRYEALCD